MKNLKHKFILFVLGLIFLILLVQISLAFRTKDTNSYVTLVEGTATVNETILEIQKKYKVHIGDIIKTGEKGLVVVEWGDGSITRLGAESELVIKETLVSENLSQIQIAAEIVKGKAWSKVVTNLSDKSYFKMYFENIEAGVRGTTFDIDLEREVLFVQDHEISLKKGNLPIIKIGENQPFSLSLFSFIDLQRYLKEIQDINWSEVNKKLDSEYAKQLSQEALTSLEKNQPFLVFLEIFMPKYRVLAELHGNQDEKKIETLINSLSQKQKQSLYEDVYQEYQSINFAGASNVEVYKKKLLYKRVLLLLTNDSSVKESLVKGSVYDFQDILSQSNVAGFQETLQFLSEQKETVKSLPSDIKESLNIKDINILPDDLKEIMLKNTGMFQEIFQIDVTKWDLSIDGLKSINEKATDAVNSTLDKALNTILKK